MWTEKPFGRWRARWDIVAQAAFRAHEKTARGRKLWLQRGQFLASVDFLCVRWGWSVGKVRIFLDSLRDDGFVENVKRTSVGTVYVVVRYEELVGHGEALVAEEPPPKKPAKGPTKKLKPVGPPPAEGCPPEDRQAWEDRVIEHAVATLPPVPEDLKTPAFVEAWRERLIERAEKMSRGKISFTQVKSQLKKLSRLRELKGIDAVVEAVERATHGGYAGVVFKEDMETPADRARQQGQQQSLFQPTDEPRGRRKKKDVV